MRYINIIRYIMYLLDIYVYLLISPYRVSDKQGVITLVIFHHSLSVVMTLIYYFYFISFYFFTPLFFFSNVSLKKKIELPVPLR